MSRKPAIRESPVSFRMSWMWASRSLKLLVAPAKPPLSGSGVSLLRFNNPQRQSGRTWKRCLRSKLCCSQYALEKLPPPPPPPLLPSTHHSSILPSIQPAINLPFCLQPASQPFIHPSTYPVFWFLVFISFFWLCLVLVLATGSLAVACWI